MYIEQWTYYRVKEQSVCNNAHSEELNNLQAERTQFSIHVHRVVNIFKVKKQSVCNNAHSEEFKITYTLKEPSSVSMYIEQWTYFRLKIISV